MPELPEVEVTRLSFASAIAGAQIEHVRLGKALRWPLGCAPEDLMGLRVRAVRRRAKYLLLDLSATTDPLAWQPQPPIEQGIVLVHLGMSGRLIFAPCVAPPQKHDHFDLHTSQGVLRLHDPRRFGAVVFVASEQALMARKLLGHLGLEPLSADFTPEALCRGLRARRAPIKQVLLAGHVVVGVGNIYASEVLFRAGIAPTSPACTIDEVRVHRLHQAIRTVLTSAIEHGGTTLKDFVSADGKSGHFQTQTQVYGRHGQPCLQCGRVIECIVQGQRSSYFCPHCQP